MLFIIQGLLGAARGQCYDALGLETGDTNKMYCDLLSIEVNAWKSLGV